MLPLAAAAWATYRRAVRSGILFAPASRLPLRTATWRTYLSSVLPVFFLAGLFLSIIALARPQSILSQTRRNADVIAIEMVVDVSGSMEALDLSPQSPAGTKYLTRLDVVKKTFAEFVDERPDDLIGIVTFGGFAATRAPLTLDHDALLHVLKGIEIPRTTQGRDGNIVNNEELLTAIGDGLATACARIQDTEAKSRIIVLLSDGKSNAGLIKPEQAANAAKTLGIKVYTIGVGSTGMAPVFGRDMFGQKRLGRMRVVLDEAQLKSIAKTTGGRYFNVKDPNGLQKAMKEINKLETTSIERNITLQYDELFLLLLVPAAILIALGTGLNMFLAKRIT